MKRIMVLFLFLCIGLFMAQEGDSGESGEEMMGSGDMNGDSMMKDGMMGDYKSGLLGSELLYILAFLLLAGLVILVYLNIWAKVKELKKK